MNIKKELVRAHLKPVPRVSEGKILVREGVRTGMDISDGLVGDLTHICTMSNVGAHLDVSKVPVSQLAYECLGQEALELALSGGEDYELLFTAPGEIVESVKNAVKCPVTIVGEIVAEHPGKVETMDSAGNAFKLKKGGWDHFNGNSR